MSAATRIGMVSALLLFGCGSTQVMRGRIEGLQKIVEQAERNGAVRCAPRELAMGKSHLRFAEIELDQGMASRATTHLELAEPNVRAAYSQSPPEMCAERGYVIEKPGDKDGDGYLDVEDKCVDEPETWNQFDDADGCPDDPDTDGDGLTDSKDTCPLDPEDKDGYLDDDGCPELDNDADGIVDTLDRLDSKDCRNDAEDPDGFEDSDGCPDLDNDKDSVTDLEDMCPNEPGSADGEKKGCPKKSLAIVTDKEIKILQQIHFEYNKAVIRPESFPVVDAVAEILKAHPKIHLEVQGHTDNRGSATYNQSLSEKRAHSVMKALVARGIDPARVRSQGYGMQRPIVPNDTENNRALNRRVQFIRVESESNGDRNKNVAVE